MERILYAALAFFALSLPAAAENLLSRTDIDSCIESRGAANQSVTGCVDLAQNQCAVFGAKAPYAALQCYRGAKEEWEGYIRTKMQDFALNADEKIAAIARIEVKYDLLQNLLQCDRMVELQLLQEPSAEESALQRTRCEATATGLVYVKFYWQSRSIK